MNRLHGRKFAKVGAAILVMGAGAGTAGVANGFTDYHTAAADQYGTTPTVTVGVTATGTVSTPAASGNLGASGSANVGAGGSKGTKGTGKVKRRKHSSGNGGNKGVAGNGAAGNKGVAGSGQAGVAGSRNQLPFTGLNLVTLVIVALLLGALGLFFRALQRGTRGRTARSRA